MDRGGDRIRREAVFLFVVLTSLRECLLLAQSGHSDCRNECLLLEVKRTLLERARMSPSDPERRFATTVFRVSNFAQSP